MNLEAFFEELAYGELSDLSMVEDGQIKSESQAKIAIKLNDVLSQLYTYYVIKLEDTVLNTSIKALTYNLTSPNAVRIVYLAPDLPNEEAIYKNNDQFTLKGNRVSFRKLPVADQFRMTYQWKPLKLKINPTSSGYLKQDIGADDVLVPLVRLLVASAIYQNMNGELHKKTGIELFNQAQFVRNELETSGVLNISVDFKNIRFRLNGFT